MIKTKNKWITLLIVLLVLFFITGAGGFNRAKDVTSPNIESLGELEGKNMGGVLAKMPDNSAKTFFETLLGEKLSSYQSYDSVIETVSALKSNEIDVAWFSDITAKYLLKTEQGLREVKTPDVDESRLEFAFAIKQGNFELREKMNEAIHELKENGTLDRLIATYVDRDTYDQKYYEKDMVIKKNDYQGTFSRTLYVGVTGAVPPLDFLDIDNKPVGFSVALMDAIGQHLSYDIKFVAMKNDTAFSNLMSGKVDLLFCYGTSKNTVDRESKYNYIMTDGYYTMDKYAYLVLE